MSEKMGEDRDDGSIAELEMANPTTLTNKILKHAGFPLGIAFCASMVVYKYYDENLDDHHGSEVNAVSAEREKSLVVVRNVSRVKLFEQCAAGLNPSEGCAEQMDGDFERDLEMCSSVNETSEVLDCCSEFSEKLRVCLVRSGVRR